MSNTRPVEGGNMQARLRQVEDHVLLTFERRRQPDVSAPPAERAAAPRVPMPRRVSVYLRGHAGFGEITITHPTPAARPAPAS